MIAIIAALPREVAGLTSNAAPDRELRKRGIHVYRVGDALIVAAGMGAGRAALAVEAALAAAPVELLVSAGLAGACSADVRAGDVLEAGMVIDARTGERFGVANADATGTLVTNDAIASVGEKARLAAAYGAAMVDMEAAAVARLAAAHGLRFRAVKGISDAHDFELASLSRFGGKRGEFRTAAFALHTALRPATWGKAVRLGRESGRALAGLQSALRAVIDERV